MAQTGVISRLPFHTIEKVVQYVFDENLIFSAFPAPANVSSKHYTKCKVETIFLLDMEKFVYICTRYSGLV